MLYCFSDHQDIVDVGHGGATVSQWTARSRPHTVIVSYGRSVEIRAVVAGSQAVLYDQSCPGCCTVCSVA